MDKYPSDKEISEVTGLKETFMGKKVFEVRDNRSSVFTHMYVNWVNVLIVLIAGIILFSIVANVIRERIVPPACTNIVEYRQELDGTITQVFDCTPGE